MEIVQTLQNISLSIVCKNLEFICLILLTFKEKNISLSIRDLIFSFYLDNTEKLRRRDLEIFTFDFFAISVLHSKKLNNFPTFLSKINTTKLLKLDVICDCFEDVVSLKYLSKTNLKQLQILKFQCGIGNVTAVPANWMKEVCKIIDNFLKNTGKNLTKLIIYFDGPDDMNFTTLSKMLEMNEKLTIFKFTENKNIAPKYIPFSKYTRSMHEYLKEMVITLPHNLSSMEIYGFFRKFPNLKSLELGLLEKYHTFKKQRLIVILNALLQIKNTLKILRINIHALTNIKNYDFFLRDVQHLDKFRLKTSDVHYKFGTSKNKKFLEIFTKMEKDDVKNMIKSLKRDKVDLHKIYFSDNLIPLIKDHENFLNDLIDLSKIVETVRISCVLNIEEKNDDIPLKLKYLENLEFFIKLKVYRYFDNCMDLCSQLSGSLLLNSIRYFSCNFSSFDTFYNITELFSNFHNLKTVHCSDICDDEDMYEICCGLLNSAHTLEELLFQFSSNVMLQKDSFKTLIKSLKTLKRLYLMAKFDFYRKSLITCIKENLCETLTHFFLSYCHPEFSSDILEMLENLKKLQYFEIYFDPIPTIEMQKKFMKSFPYCSINNLLKLNNAILYIIWRCMEKGTSEVINSYYN